MSPLLVVSAALPALAAMIAIAAGPHRSRLVARVGAALNGAALVAALVVFTVVWLDGPVSAVIESAGGQAIAGLYADRITSVLLLLVIGVSFIVQAFASRYLSGDVRATRFFIGANLLTFSTAFMVAAVTFIAFAVAWTLAGLSLILLLAMYSGFPAAREGVRRTVKIFLIGDAALWAAVVLATVEWGGLDLRQLGQPGSAIAGEGFALVAVACLMVVGAIARSAQVPLQNWLPATIAVPTPVSALLHAGVVNAGGILLVRMSPVFGASTEATHFAFAIGVVTTVYGTALMLSKADVKGALAHSTMGQMGFMIMTCGLGTYAATIFHLFAHGMYKATLFLGSGSAVHSHVRQLKAPPVKLAGRAQGIWVALVSAAIPAVALPLSAAVLYPGMTTATAALLLFAWATGAWVAWGWIRRHPSWSGSLTAAGIVTVLSAVYVFALDTAGRFFAPALTGAGTESASGWWIAALLVALLAVASLRFISSGGRVAELRKDAYVSILGAGQVKDARRGATGAEGAVTAGTGGLIAGSQGAGS